MHKTCLSQGHFASLQAKKDVFNRHWVQAVTTNVNVLIINIKSHVMITLTYKWVIWIKLLYVYG